MSERINPNVEVRYQIGDPVYFYDIKKKQWKKGTALIRLGKILYLRFGNFLRRVPIEKCRPDPHGEVVQEESYIDCNKDLDDIDKEEECDVKEMVEELDLAEEVSKLKREVEELEVENNVLRENSHDVSIDKLSSGIPSSEVPEVHLLRKARKKMKKEKKKEEVLQLPKTHDLIEFKLKNKDEVMTGRIVGSYKKTSKYKHWKHVKLDNDLIMEFDFEKDVEAWK